MTTKLDTFGETQLRKVTPQVQPGDTVRVHLKITEGDRERVQVFEGVVLARKHGSGPNATITVRRVNKGYGVERVFPLHSPVIAKIEVVRRAKVRRAKLYYLREAKGRKARLKAESMGLVFEEPKEESPQEPEGVPEERAEGEPAQQAAAAETKEKPKEERPATEEVKAEERPKKPSQ